MIGMHAVSRDCPCLRCKTLIAHSDQMSGHLEERMEGTHKNNITDWAGKYVIWSPDSSLPIQYGYDDKPTAIKVAYSMANRYPNQSFIVMKVSGVAKTSAVTFTDLETPKPVRKTRVKLPTAGPL